VPRSPYHQRREVTGGEAEREVQARGAAHRGHVFARRLVDANRREPERADRGAEPFLTAA
jgi:hypothetical protein